jgi:hypothetical protein
VIIKIIFVPSPVEDVFRYQEHIRLVLLKVVAMMTLYEHPAVPQAQ